MNAVLLEAWRVWDFIYQHFTRLEYVDKKNGNIFRIVFCKYKGPQLVTRDGVEINYGDYIVKLHIHNLKLTKMLKGITDETRLGLNTLKIVKSSLPELALYIERNPKREDVKAIIGTTFLHRGVNKLGFDVACVPASIKFKIKNEYLKLLLSLIHPNGLNRLKTKPNELYLKRVYMSKESLFNYYAQTQEPEGKT